MTRLRDTWKDFRDAAGAFSRPARFYLVAEFLMWTAHGVFGVLSSALAVFVSIQYSISANFLLAAVCYAALFPFLKALVAASQAAPRALLIRASTPDPVPPT